MVLISLGIDAYYVFHLLLRFSLLAWPVSESYVDFIRNGPIPGLDGLVRSYGTEGRRFESTMIRRVPEAAGELEPRNRRPRYRACLHGDSVDSELASSPSDS